MPFRKMTKPQYPPRLWALVGRPGSGKSTFATAMRAPLLPIDADHRFAEVLDLVPGDTYQFGDDPSDSTSADRIAAILTRDMPGSDVATIVVDSLTAIITPLVTQAIVDKDQGREKNLYAAFRGKALAMRQLQDAVTRWGTDVLWIYHLNDARDAQGKEHVKATVSATELARLTRSINLQLEIVVNGKRGVKVVWARRGRSGMIVWDDTGTWAGMPEKIEAAVYDGLSRAEQDRIERDAPGGWPNAETAIAWGLERGAFSVLQHARNAYEKLRRDHPAATLQDLNALWAADVEARVLAGVTEPTEPQPAHAKPGRPLAADKLRAGLRKRAGWQGDARPDNEPLTEPQTISVPHLIAEATKTTGMTQADLDKARHTVLEYLFGVTSTNALTKLEATAIIDWLKTDGAGWGCNEYAAAEATAVIAAWLESQGQQKLL